MISFVFRNFVTLKLKLEIGRCAPYQALDGLACDPVCKTCWGFNVCPRGKEKEIKREKRKKKRGEERKEEIEERKRKEEGR